MNSLEQATKIYHLLKAKPGLTILNMCYSDFNGTVYLMLKGYNCRITPTESNYYTLRITQPHNRVEDILIKQIHDVATNNLRNTLDKILSGEIPSDNLYMRNGKIVGMSREEYWANKKKVVL